MDGTMLGSHSVRQVAQERQRSRRLTGRSGLVLLLLAATLALFAGPGGVVSPSVAEASHGQLMTLRGTVTINGYPQAGATVKEWYWTGSSWQLARTTTTDSSGRYAIVAGRGHYFYLSASKTIGTGCLPYAPGIWQWSGSTNYFYTSTSLANPTYINIPISGGQIC